MKLSEVRFALVEDREDMAEDIVSIAKLAGLSGGHCIGKYPDVASARAGLTEKWREIDLLLLDLNIPLSSQDPLPEKRHGAGILDLILHDLNTRGNHKISVIIVSGEVEPTWERELWLGKYKSVVFGLATKGQLSVTLPEILLSYCEGHYISQIRAHWSAAEQSFQTIINEKEDTERRSLACQTLACLILGNIAQYEQNLPDQNGISGQQLKPLLSDYLARNFTPDKASGRVYSTLKQLKGPANAWVIRGYLVEYLWTINNLRNAFIHLDTMPFHNGAGNYGIWASCQDEIKRLEGGERICQILTLMVQDLLDWYLPWHRKVYLPWLKAKTQPTAPTK